MPGIALTSSSDASARNPKLVPYCSSEVLSALCATSRAVSPTLPVPRRMATSSASESSDGTRLESRSLGLSCSGQSLIVNRSRDIGTPPLAPSQPLIPRTTGLSLYVERLPRIWSNPTPARLSSPYTLGRGSPITLEKSPSIPVTKNPPMPCSA